MRREAEIRAICVDAATPLREAIQAMDHGGEGIVLVVDADGRLQGTVTDGDVRRGILRGVRLDDSVQQIVCAHPTTVAHGSPREDLLRLMQQHGVEHLPVVDHAGRVAGLELMSELLARPRDKETPVAIVAGGLGTRLRPLTDDTPKALLKVGDRPLLEVLIDQLVGYGFRNVVLIVHHQAEMIERQLGNGQALGARIQYVRERKPLGTVGGLRLAAPHVTAPCLVVNGDLLTRVNFEHLLNFHERQQCDLTMAVKEYDVQIPYGVVQLSDGLVCHLEEKPSQRLFVNAGIYVLDPSLISLIPEDEPYDMTQLIQAALAERRRVASFPIHEYWLDVGRTHDYAQAQVHAAGWSPPVRAQ